MTRRKFKFEDLLKKFTLFVVHELAFLEVDGIGILRKFLDEFGTDAHLSVGFKGADVIALLDYRLRFS